MKPGTAKLKGANQLDTRIDKKIRIGTSQYDTQSINMSAFSELI